MFSHTTPADCDACCLGDTKGNSLKRSPFPETTRSEQLMQFLYRNIFPSISKIHHLPATMGPSEPGSVLSHTGLPCRTTLMEIERLIQIKLGLELQSFHSLFPQSKVCQWVSLLDCFLLASSPGSARNPARSATAAPALGAGHLGRKPAPAPRIRRWKRGSAKRSLLRGKSARPCVITAVLILVLLLSWRDFPQADEKWAKEGRNQRTRRW